MDARRDGGQSRRANGVALGYSLGRVTNCVELIRYLAHVGWQLGHLSDTASVVRDWAERIKRYDNTCHG